MSKLWLAAACVVGAAATWIATARNPAIGSADAPHRRVMYYRDPMHPSYTSPQPGKAPDCGMDLVPVYADETAAASPGTVRIDERTQKTMGLTFERVTRAPVARTFKTFGRVVADENRVVVLTAGGDGWVTRLHDGSRTGETVRKGQPLASLYGREYTTAQRTYLFALNAVENPPPTPGSSSQGDNALALEEARLFLMNTGFSEAQLAQLARTRQVIPEVTLTAPIDGVIVGRRIAQHERVERGAELFKIADLTHVWIVASLFGRDAAVLRPGSTAVVIVPSEDKRVRAVVSDALPAFEPASSQVKVRLDVDNATRLLRPDMTVDVEFSSGSADVITVPEAAVVQSGAGQTVFVAADANRFEARQVETGWRTAGRVVIADGLQPGESVVVEGAFLLDSAVRMRQANPAPHD
jgi:multidrug efflux pump subunit AcrA (membrane-fusion protein)